MTHTQIDEISRRNVELQDEAQKAEDRMTAEVELHGQTKSELERVKVALGQATHDKTVAERTCAEAEKRAQIATTQLGKFKDQGKKIGKLEASNKALKEQVASLKQAADQRAGTPDVKAKLEALQAEVKDLKAQYSGVWQERKLLSEALDRVCERTHEALSELIPMVPEPEDKDEKKVLAKRKKAWRELVKELGKE